MIRVLVVDDSATMRGLIAATLRRDPEIEVVGLACDSTEARQAIKALNPDVLTLDIEMPAMNGLEFLDKIMRLRPMPVIMVSSLTSRGADATLRALELGAFDCVAKPSVAGPGAFDHLPDTVRAAARARLRPSGGRASSAPAMAGYRSDGRLLAIGSSTGGVEALLTILSALPANGPPTVITQHMPATFTRSFAERLNRTCAAEVSEAGDGAVLQPGRVYLAPGGEAHLQVVGSSPPRCRLVPGPLTSGHRPSVDALFASVAKAVGPRALGVILTGMGRDGAQGLLAMRGAGARTLGQDEASCVV
ncbi:protein-glutamate methylesterase/protein-glutamine glutaminase [Muricoccus radiodurans]|uniref:protein-glutamate methylesterase/protein-glutamine glutaminase n=1 Tax=Muricoccus radiodurans TaxID=2231721 RepID=UPI003CECF142